MLRPPHVALHRGRPTLDVTANSFPGTPLKLLFATTAVLPRLVWRRGTLPSLPFESLRRRGWRSSSSGGSPFATASLGRCLSPPGPIQENRRSPSTGRRVSLLALPVRSREAARGARGSPVILLPTGPPWSSATTPALLALRQAVGEGTVGALRAQPRQRLRGRLVHPRRRARHRQCAFTASVVAAATASCPTSSCPSSIRTPTASRRASAATSPS